MHVAVVNCSPVYNPAVPKLALWEQQENGVEVTFFSREHPPLPMDFAAFKGGRVLFSVIFSWDLPWMVEMATWAMSWNVQVEVGGPAAEMNAAWVKEQLGVEVWRGQHPCHRVILPNPQMTWTSRGCPKRCPYCLVWQLEGDLVEIPDFQPAPKIMDNNFLACSEAHQRLVLEKLVAAGIKKIDFNQGLDVSRYSPRFRAMLGEYGLKLKVWRFAYDNAGDWPAVERALLDLREAGMGWSRIQVYVLYNFREPPAEAVARAERVIGDHRKPWACPWPMAFRPLDWMDPDCDYVAPGWTLRQVRDFRRYFSRPKIWRVVAWEDYSRSYIQKGGLVAALGERFGGLCDGGQVLRINGGWSCDLPGRPRISLGRTFVEAMERIAGLEEDLVSCYEVQGGACPGVEWGGAEGVDGWQVIDVVTSGVVSWDRERSRAVEEAERLNAEQLACPAQWR